MTNRDATARLAGLLYLGSLPTAGFAYGYVEFMPHASPSATLAWLTAHRAMLGWTVIAGAAGFVDYLLFGLLLRQLLAPTRALLADLMLILVVASVPLSFAALADRLDLLALIDSASPQGAPEATLHLRHEHNLFQVSAIFWGLWLLPLGWLLWHSRLAPRAIAALLVLGGIGYLWAFAAPTLDAHYAESLLARSARALFTVPDLIGELGFGLWILIRGARGMTSSEGKA